MKLHQLLFVCLTLFVLASCSNVSLKNNNKDTEAVTQSLETLNPSTIPSEKPQASPSAQEGQASYYKKSFTGGLHSIYIDESGNLYTGSLGDKPSQVRQIAPKQVLEIAQDGTVTTLGTIETRYITGVIADKQKNVYALVYEEKTGGRLIKIDNEGALTELSSGFGEAGGLTFDTEGNLYYSADKIYQVSPTGEVHAFFNKGGRLSPDLKYVYVITYGGQSVMRYSLENKDAPPELVAEGLKYTKNMAFGNTGLLYVLDFDTKDSLVMIDQQGNKKSIQIDLSIANGNVDKRHMINNLAVDKSSVEDRFIYLTTWNGDIIQVALPIQ